jgi:hypothetical protein
MSNRLANIAKRITSLGGRKMHASEKGVLLALCDDARDHLGGRSRLTNRQLQGITGLSERAIRMAITALAEAGHISREIGEPGAPPCILVHPGEAGPAVAAPADIAAPGATIASPPGNHCRGSYRERNNNQVIQPSDHTTGGRAREPSASDEVEQVFAAWDAFHQRVGLQPVARGMARRGAVAARIAEAGIGNTLMVVDRTERARREGRAPKGQGDLFFGFDIVFGVGRAAALNVFDRMLDGEFGGAEAAVIDAPAPAVASVPGEGPAEAEVRAAAAQLLGSAQYQAWLAPVRMALGPDGLTITAGSAFAADHITNEIAPKLRRPGMAVRVVRERVGA